MAVACGLLWAGRLVGTGIRCGIWPCDTSRTRTPSARSRWSSPTKSQCRMSLSAVERCVHLCACACLHARGDDLPSQFPRPSRTPSPTKLLLLILILLPRLRRSANILPRGAPRQASPSGPSLPERGSPSSPRKTRDRSAVCAIPLLSAPFTSPCPELPPRPSALNAS